MMTSITESMCSEGALKNILAIISVINILSSVEAEAVFEENVYITNIQRIESVIKQAFFKIVLFDNYLISLLLFKISDIIFLNIYHIAQHTQSPHAMPSAYERVQKP